MVLPELSDEEVQKLLEVASQPAKPGENINLNAVECWIMAKDIKPGNARLTAMHLWWEYVKWDTKNPVTKRTFFVALKKLFPKKTSHYHRYPDHYMLDPASFDMSLDTQFLINKMLRDERLKRKKYARKI